MKSSKVDVKYQKWTLIIQNYKKDKASRHIILAHIRFSFPQTVKKSLLWKIFEKKIIQILTKLQSNQNDGWSNIVDMILILA